MTKTQYLEAIALANKASDAYYDNDDPIMSDVEFDALMQSIKKYEKESGQTDKNSPTLRVGGHQGKSSFEKVTHSVPMLSLLDVFSSGDVEDFLFKFPLDTGFSIEEKIDGLSMSVTYENGSLVRAETRGDGYVGEDITENAKFIKGIPLCLKDEARGLELLEIRCEVFLPVARFLELNKERERNEEKLFANPRNAAAGLLRTKDISVVKKAGLEAFCFNIQRIKWTNTESSCDISSIMNSHTNSLHFLDTLGIQTVAYRLVIGRDDVLAEIQQIGERRNGLPYWIDGAVIKIDNLRDRKKIGETAKYPKWAVAYKYPPEEKETTVKDIVLQTGRTGRITPVAVLEPVFLAGTKVERATLNNQGFINSLGVNIGDTVRIRKAAEIIPEIIGCTKVVAGVFHIGDHTCPSCGGKLVLECSEGNGDKSSHRCINSDSCAAQISRKFEFWASRECTDIRGFGPAQIDKFIELGWLKTIPDIYKLKDHAEEMKNIDGFGTRSVKALLNSIEKSKGAKFDRIIKGLGIPGVGRHVGKKLAKKYMTIFDVGGYTVGAETRETKLKELAEIDGIGEITAKAILDFFTHENLSILFELQKLGVNMESDCFSKTVAEPQKKSVFAGKTVVITGSLLSYSRSKISEMIEDIGGTVSGSVSGKTDYLICGEKAGSKLDKAKKLGVKILSENDFVKMIEE